MSLGYRMLSELRASDRSNETLKFNRTMKEAGLRGGFDDHPSGPGFVGMLFWATVGSFILGVFLLLALGL